MYFHRLISLSLAFALTATATSAAQVTLKSTSSSVEIVGELKSFDNEVYVVETDLGELEVDARTVTCSGDVCPEVVNLASEVSIFGDKQLIDQLLVPLMEGYSFSIGANVETATDKTGHANITVIGQDGTDFAKISVQPSAASNLNADISKNPNAIVVKQGSAALLAQDAIKTAVTPLAADAIVVAVSEINQIRSISQESLQDVLSGKITSWKDLGGADVDINLYLTEKNTNFATLSKTMGYDTAETGTAARFKTLDDIAKAVSQDPYGLGIINYANLRTAKALPIVGACGAYVKPNTFNITTGTYPGTYYHYLAQGEKRPPIFAREFLSFLEDSQAKDMIERFGFPSLSLQEKDLEDQGNRITYGLLATSKNVPITEYRSMLNILNGARQLSTIMRFAPGGLDLDTQSSAALEALVSELFLGNYADQKLMIVGFTESDGSLGENKRNSKAAAQLISRYIKNADSGGILADLQMEIHGFGEASPLVCEDTPEGAATNNRVEIWVKDSF
ncbi:OmpA family protein [Amylibacter sp. SFDW26]|uniref:phosphate ABC transporter substrate-binding/OmpA family protein n=1 Tax=Amylibacter sp. SFDW26 TaxID=2652722 RepID=UPI0012625FAB|nr:phosphate ABC transporter substrate-binding/OmpA family protein [Amylibacter sp. SFDW26]KAB7614596.1 OmpA family protein [Amylibacter sp. SFDW26]